MNTAERVPTSRRAAPLCALRQAARREHRCSEGLGFRRGVNDGLQDFIDVFLQLVDPHALVGEPDGRFDDLLQRQAAELLMDGEQARHDTRHGNRAHTDMEFLRRGAKIRLDGIKIEVPLGVGGRFGEEIEHP